jgi:phosphatidylglycerophosphate synthase
VVIRQVRDAGAFDRELVAAGAAQLTVLAALAGTLGLHGVGWLAGLLFMVAVQLLTGLCGPAARAAAAGPANRVTLSRAVLIGGVTALIADGLVHGGLHGVRLTVLVAMASVALALDLVDGWVARRTGTESELGARLDMEMDALLVLVLSVLAAVSLGAWVLVIGLMRYLFVLAGNRYPWLCGSLPPSRARKVVAAVQGVVLTVVCASVLPVAVASAAVIGALVTLLWSFGRDTLWLAAQPR